MVLRIVVGLGLTAVALAVAGHRLWWLKRLALSGQPAPDRIEAARAHLGRRSEERRVGKECYQPCRSRWSPYH